MMCAMSLSRTSRVTVGVAFLVIAAGMLGFVGGRATAPSSGTPSTGPCDEVHQTAGRMLEAGPTPLTDTGRVGGSQDPVAFLSLPNLILQNPNCFSANDRAQAQTLKEMQTQAEVDSLRRSMCNAADRGWWC